MKYAVGDKLRVPEGSALWREGFRETIDIIEVESQDDGCAYFVSGTHDGERWDTWCGTEKVEECPLAETYELIEWEED